MGQKITVFVILTQAIGAGLIVPLPVNPLAVDAPVEVTETDLAVFGNGLLDGVYIIINGFVHAFNPPVDDQIPVHEAGVVAVALTAELVDQLPGFFLGQIPA